MSGRFSDPNWWPTPPPKPPKAPSEMKLVFGTLVAALVVVGAFVALSGFGHSGHKAKTAAAAAPAAPVAVGVDAARAERRQALQQCLKSMGAGSGPRGGGRFGGGGPSKSFRNAYDVCRSLLQPNDLVPAAPRRTSTTAPIA
jgi:hypothetical protein